MSIKYYLLNNTLPEAGADEKIAKVMKENAISLDQLIAEIVATNVELKTEVYTKDVMLFLNKMKEYIVTGQRIHTPLFHTQYSIKGKFITMNDNFDPSRHKIKANLTFATDIEQEIQKCSVEKVSRDKEDVSIIDVQDTITTRTNEIITPGEPLIIWGHNIKIEGDPSQIGIFFVNTQTKEEVPSGQLLKNSVSELFVKAPILTDGEWLIRIRTQHSSAKNQTTKRLKEGTSKMPLSVVQGV